MLLGDRGNGAQGAGDQESSTLTDREGNISRDMKTPGTESSTWIYVQDSCKELPRCRQPPYSGLPAPQAFGREGLAVAGWGLSMDVAATAFIPG